MKFEAIASELKLNIGETDTPILYLDCNQIANLLRISGETLLKYLRYSNQKTGIDSEGFISETIIEKLGSLYEELSFNFFPMAHSDKPLAHLQIMDRDKITHLNDILSNLQNKYARANEEALLAIEMLLKI